MCLFILEKFEDVILKVDHSGLLLVVITTMAKRNLGRKGLTQLIVPCHSPAFEDSQGKELKERRLYTGSPYHCSAGLYSPMMNSQSSLYSPVIDSQSNGGTTHSELGHHTLIHSKDNSMC